MVDALRNLMKLYTNIVENKTNKGTKLFETP